MKAPKQNQDKQKATRNWTRAAKRAAGRKAKRIIKRAVKHATKRQATARKQSGDQGEPVPGSHEAFLAVKCCCDGWMRGAARKTRLRVRALVCGEIDEPKPAIPEQPVPRCPHCHASMKLLAVIKPRGPPTIPTP